MIVNSKISYHIALEYLTKEPPAEVIRKMNSKIRTLNILIGNRIIVDSNSSEFIDICNQYRKLTGEDTINFLEIKGLYGSPSFNAVKIKIPAKYRDAVGYMINYVIVNFNINNSLNMAEWYYRVMEKTIEECGYEDFVKVNYVWYHYGLEEGTFSEKTLTPC